LRVRHPVALGAKVNPHGRFDSALSKPAAPFGYVQIFVPLAHRDADRNIRHAEAAWASRHTHQYGGYRRSGVVRQ